MSERISGLIVGFLLMVIGIGLFLWDWYGRYIHFFWFIPFIILGPIIFICGFIVIFKALFSSRKSFKKTAPRKRLKKPVHRYPTPGIYHNKKYNFSIQPPNNWTVDKSGRLFKELRKELGKENVKKLKTSTLVTFLGPREEYPFVPVISISVQDMKYATFDEWISEYKQDASKVIPAFLLLSERIRKVNDLDAYEEVHTGSSIFDGRALKQKQVVLLKDGKVYMIVYTVPLYNYDKYLYAFEASVQTFKF